MKLTKLTPDQAKYIGVDVNGRSHDLDQRKAGACRLTGRPRPCPGRHFKVQRLISAYQAGAFQVKTREVNKPAATRIGVCSRSSRRSSVLLIGAIVVAVLASGQRGLARGVPAPSQTILEFEGPRTVLWGVPEKVTKVTFEIYGAQGGNCGFPGGLGGKVIATIPVTPGEILLFLIGGQGGDRFPGGAGCADINFDGALVPGGFNGGGPGGASVHSVYNGSGGGGATDVRRPPYGLFDRILTAGGGGGAGNNRESFDPHGGHGGGLIGERGDGNGQGGGGGTQFVGGLGGPNGGGGQPGINGLIGEGGEGASLDWLLAGGGGGGGWFGGGGGGSGAIAGGGGGGGSSHGPEGALFTRGSKANDGLVILTYEPDANPPVLKPPSSFITGMTNTLGANVSYIFSAFDAEGLIVSSSCSPASGSVFALGISTVTCRATDDAGNTATGMFTITVADLTPPILNAPGPIRVNAESPYGAAVTFTVRATDNLDPNPSVVCTPASGSVFPIGDTTVDCTATDASANAAASAFLIHVKGAAEQIAELQNAVTGGGPGRSLEDKLAGIQASVATGDRILACSALGAFINEVRAQAGKTITSSDAARFTTQAINIRRTLGC